MANQNKPKQAANPVRSAANNLKPTGQPANQANLTPKVAPVGGPAAPRKLTPKQEAARRRAQKRRRVQLVITGAIVLVVAAALIALGISISQPTVFNNIPAATSVDERPFELGPADAKVVVEEYGDYQCPFCKQWHEDTQPLLINDYIKSGKSVKFVFKPFPFLDANSATRESHLTTEAAYCAADQKRFWDYDNAIYDNQPKSENSGYWTANRLKALAKALQLDTNQFNSCMDSNKYRSKATTDATDAQNRGVTGTPTFFVNGTAVQGQDYASLKTAIDAALSK
jgi:protein-disulfide isomerase